MRGAPLIFDDPELWGPNQQKKKTSEQFDRNRMCIVTEREREVLVCGPCRYCTLYLFKLVLNYQPKHLNEVK